MPSEPQYGSDYEYHPEEREAAEEEVQFEDEYEMSPGDAAPEQRRLGTGEPVYLYIETSRGVFDIAGDVFDSKIEATQWVEKNYPGATYKVLYESEALAEAEKMRRRQEKVDKVKGAVVSGAKAVGGAVKDVGRDVRAGARHAVKETIPQAARDSLEASYNIADEAGLTREAMNRRFEPSQRRSYQPPEPQRRDEPAVSLSDRERQERGRDEERMRQKGIMHLPLSRFPAGAEDRPVHFEFHQPQQRQRPQVGGEIRQRPESTRGERRGEIREPRRTMNFNPNPQPFKPHMARFPGQERRQYEPEKKAFVPRRPSKKRITKKKHKSSSKKKSVKKK